ncbi:MAG: B12-binding domain-containing radical SAM protein [Phycisphaerae bacterium]|nr:B12-binding domain-containing radical SAM protein [Phycisphaerae bacterium]
MSERLDLLLINPGGRGQSYQALGNEFSAVEPPVWVGLLATNVRNAGYSVQILDAEAEGHGPREVARCVVAARPRLAMTVVFGANPSASTQKMTAAGAICAAIRQAVPEVRQMLGGLHVSALPERTLREEAVDFVCQGEGPYTLRPLLEALRTGGDAFAGIPGLWYRADGRIVSNAPAPLIADLDAELPGVAWDLLPMGRYRAHNWHCFDHIDQRSPYAVIYTSLGCPFGCTFCCINALFGKSGIRYRAIGGVLSEIDLLANRYGVRNIKILDELFVARPDRIHQLCDALIERRYDLNIWAYARVDTVTPELLAKLRSAGVRWLAYGFESASERVRIDVRKGVASEKVDNAVRWTRDAGSYIIANYMVGLPEDDHQTMQATLDEAIRYNFEYLNLYCAMAYPGSKLYDRAVAEGWPLPKHWHGYSQLGEETLPLPTKHLTSAEVLRFRDRAFVAYHSRPEYLDRLRRKFGQPVVDHMRRLLSQEIHRKHD